MTFKLFLDQHHGSIHNLRTLILPLQFDSPLRIVLALLPVSRELYNKVRNSLAVLDYRDFNSKVCWWMRECATPGGVCLDPGRNLALTQSRRAQMAGSFNGAM